jgi:protein-tyrosine phosphatase
MCYCHSGCCCYCKSKLYRRSFTGVLLSFLLYCIYDLSETYYHLPGAKHCIINNTAIYPQLYDGITNFRDLGDAHFKIPSGKRIKKGVFYRSSRLTHAPLSTVNTLFSKKELGIQFVADFRSEEEVWLHPDPKIPSSISNTTTHTLYKVSDTSTLSLKRGLAYGLINASITSNLMKNLNVEFALNQQKIFKKFLQDITQKNQKKTVPFLIHCTAGKDRTGWASALVLRMLQVKEEDIISDYMQSNCGYDPAARMNAVYIKMLGLLQTKTNALEALLRVKENYIRSGFDAVIQKYGTWENYIENMGLNYKKLQKRLEEILLE